MHGDRLYTNHNHCFVHGILVHVIAAGAGERMGAVWLLAKAGDSPGATQGVLLACAPLDPSPRLPDALVLYRPPCHPGHNGHWEAGRREVAPPFLGYL